MDNKASKSATDDKPGATGEQATTADKATRIDPKILELLVCPVTRKPLEYDACAQELISRSAGLAFPIKGGIPIMLVDHARELDDPAHKPG